MTSQSFATLPSGATLRSGPPPSSQSQATRLSFFAALFYVSILFSPFNGGVIVIKQLGELGGDPFSILQIVLFPLVLFSLANTRNLTTERSLGLFAVLMGAAILGGLAANFADIAGAVERGRSGLEKLATSAAVLFAGVYFAYLTSIAARLNLRAYFIQPLMGAALIVMLVGLVELASWKIDAIANIYVKFSRVIHACAESRACVAGRITSVTFEPSFFGAFACFALPWMLICFAGTKSGAMTRTYWLALIAVTLGLSLLSGRTAQVGVVLTFLVFIGIYCLFRLDEDIFALIHPLLILALIGSSLIPLWYIGAYTTEIASAMLNSGNLSNVSRFGTAAILIDLFKDHPLFGVGMGQYGFYVPTHVPYWAYNWEFKRWIESPTASFFPSFSLMARLAGETGAVGLLVWTGFTVFITNRVIVQARAAQFAAGVMPYIGIAIVVSLFGSVLYGWTAGSLRALNIWAVFGISLAYIRDPVALEYTAFATRQRFRRWVAMPPDAAVSASLK